MAARVGRESHAGGSAPTKSGTMIASTLPSCDGRTARLLWSQDEDAIVAGPAGEPAIVEEAEKWEHVLSARAGEVTGAGDRDRARRG